MRRSSAAASRGDAPGVWGAAGCTKRSCFRTVSGCAVAATSARAEPSFLWSLLVAVLTAAVLSFAVKTQIYDTNFQSLWEGASLLFGDHPYRDFFEWGMPGQMAVSAAAQWL